MIPKFNEEQHQQATETLREMLDGQKRKNAETIEQGLRMAADVVAVAMGKKIDPPKLKSSLQETIEAKAADLAETWFTIASRDPRAPFVVFLRKGGGVTIGHRTFHGEGIPDGVQIVMEIDSRWTLAQAEHFIAERLWSVPVRELYNDGQTDAAENETPTDAWRRNNKLST